MKYDSSNEYCDQNFMPEQVKANREGAFLICQQITGTNDERRLHFGVTEKPATDFLCGNSLNKLLLKNPSHSKVFVALLNSKFMDWFFRITSTNNHVQGYELEQLPIPSMTSADRRRLTKVVDRIPDRQVRQPATDTSEAEAEIDRLIYGLYGLTEAEVAAVEGSASADDQTTKGKPRFEVVPLASGYAPGVMTRISRTSYSNRKKRSSRRNLTNDRAGSGSAGIRSQRGEPVSSRRERVVGGLG